MYNKIIHFLFKELETKSWWIKDENLDQLIKNRYEEIYFQAKNAELFPWRETARGRLAEIIILDQFPRNMYRNNKKSFHTDTLALILTQEAIASNALAQLNEFQKSFLLMPLMHSESLKIQNESIRLVKQEELGNLDFAIKHKDIIERFGRFPHRNEILGRSSTQEELLFLKGPNSSF